MFMNVLPCRNSNGDDELQFQTGSREETPFSKLIGTGTV